MELSVDKIRNLPQELVQNNLLIIKTIIQELNPQLPTVRGQFYDYVTYYSAIFASLHQHDVLQLLEKNSMQYVLENPNKFSKAEVDELLSPWDCVRNTGTLTTGVVTISFKNNNRLLIPAGVKFVTEDNLVFTTTKVYRIITDKAVISDNYEINLKPATDGWEVNIPVLAVAFGDKYNIKKGTKLNLREPLSYNIKQVYSADDFVNGCDKESNETYVNRFKKETLCKLRNELKQEGISC